MDAMTYSYKPNTNQLDKVIDNAPDAALADYDRYKDIKQGQQNGNYTYDAIGNLKTDASEGITGIDWNVYGKIVRITKGSSTIYYTYDASGNRITKTANGKTTLYARDASGNVMSVYEAPAATTNIKQIETHLYGSSRLGIGIERTLADTTINLVAGFNPAILSIFTRGEKLFELSNHLGNVLVTVSDRKIGHDAGNGTIDYYNADVVTANDYYPGGMLMPGRTYNAINYAYGFNGKRKDNEMYGEGNAYDFGNRIYDPRLMRWTSVDPLQSKYPDLSPYNYVANSPINAIDPDGRLIIFINGLRGAS